MIELNEKVYQFLKRHADEVVFNFKRNDVEIIKGTKVFEGDSLDEALEIFIEHFELTFE